jgi:LysM repeat protein
MPFSSRKNLGARARLLCLWLAWVLTVAGCVAPKVSATKDTDRSATAGTSGPKRSLKQDPVYVVQPGDTLAEIAHWTTGDSGNWRAIARHNDIADPTKLRIEQRLRIPAALLEASLRATPQPARPGDGPAGPATQVRTATPVARASPPPVPIPTPKTQNPERPAQKRQGPVPPVAQASPAPVPAPAPKVKDHERPTQRVQGPVEPSSQARHAAAPPAPPQVHAAAAAQPPDPVKGWILVTGSYYPREVKDKPDPAGDSLLLVWPGTQLRYVDHQGIWYKVLTDKGEGYVDQDYAREQ